MARMRTLKPEAATSESLAEVDRGVRWTFSMFWTHCDDAGRAVSNLRLIKAAIYPLDDEITIDVLAADFVELERIGAVCRYVVNGKEYLHVPSWHEHQHPNRPQESKLPPCPKNDHSAPVHAQRSDSAVNEHEHVTPVVVGEGLVVGEGVSALPARALAVVQPEPPTAQALVGEWIEHCPKRPPGQVVGQIAKSIDRMLAEGIDPADVRRGLAAWHTKGLSPAVLPSVVNEVMNAPPMRVSRQQDETDAMFNRAAQRLGVTP